MPLNVNVQTNFTAGVWGARLRSRVDLPQYLNAVSALSNFLMFPIGGITKRPGTRFVAEVKDSADTTRLIPFKFGRTQNYIIEHGDSVMRFYKDQAQIFDITENITAITKANPAVVTITGHSFSNGDPIVIDSVGGMVELNNREFVVANVTVNTLELQGVDSTGYTTYTSGGTGNRPYELVSPFPSADINDVHWAQKFDTMWLCHPDYQPRKLTRTGHTSWTISLYAPTANPFTGAGDYPRAVTFFENRLWFGGTDNNPQDVWASKSGDFEDMTVGTGASDGLNYTLTSDESSPITWMKPSRVLVIGTRSGPFIARANTLDEPITPTNIRITNENSTPCADAMAIKVNNVVLFRDIHNRHLHEFVYDFETDSYVAPNMLQLAEHLTESSNIVDLAFQRDPEKRIWMVLADGSLHTMTYERAEDVVGWQQSPIEGTDATVKSVAVIEGSTFDEVYLLVSRTINGGTKQYVEFLENRFPITCNVDSSKPDAFFVDSGLTYSGAATTTISGLYHLEGETVNILGDGAVMPTKVVSDGKITLDSSVEKAQVGYCICSSLETQPLDLLSEAKLRQNKFETMGRKKTIHNCLARLHNTLGGSIGPTTSKLDPFTFRSSDDPMDDSPPLYCGDYRVKIGANVSREAKVVVLHTDPLPFTLLSIVADVTVGTQ